MKSKFIIALLPAALCLASCNNTLGKSFDFNKYEEYREKVVYANECLPTVNDLLQYEAVQFAYRKTSYFAMLGFQSEGISLFLDYQAFSLLPHGHGPVGQDTDGGVPPSA